MDNNNNLKRFLEAQNQTYLKALSEIKKGRKETHWMWFIFPQLRGLGQSDMATFYGISGLQEAEDYLNHPVLGKHLVEISEAVHQLEGKTALQIFGSPDHLKLKSCMTLFAAVKDSNLIFLKVLEKFFDGEQDPLTLKLLFKK